MNPSRNNYQNNFNFFNTPAISSSGFVTFQNPEDGQFYFRFNDRLGKPVLFSEGYETAMNCEFGIQSVLKNISKSDRYKTGGELGNKFIILTTGNYNEIARTRTFKDEVEIDRAIKWMMANVHEGEVMFALFEKEENNFELKKSVAYSMPHNEKAPKFAFQIELYPRDEEPLAGVIIDILKQKKQNFKGMDTKVISKFMLDSIVDPFALNADLKIDEEEETLDDPQDIEEVWKSENTVVNEPILVPQSEFQILESETVLDAKLKKNDTSEKVKKMLPIPLPLPTENLKIEIIEKKTGRLLHNIEPDTDFSIRLKMKEGIETMMANQNIKFSFKIYSMQNPNFKIQMEKEVKFSEEGIGLIDHFLKLNETGIYRIRGESVEATSIEMLTGMTSVNVFRVYELAS